MILPISIVTYSEIDSKLRSSFRQSEQRRDSASQHRTNAQRRYENVNSDATKVRILEGSEVVVL